jgi:nucleoside-diphosphate-sugar epimerase
MARVLIAGGVGFVGRSLVTYLAANKLASLIVVADKALPEVSGLSQAELAVYKSDLVAYKQSNLAKESSMEKIFTTSGGNFDFVINLAAATKYSQPPEVYKENVVDTARTLATAAAKYKCKRFIHVSTAQVYDAGNSGRKEDAKIKPWTALAKASHEAEEAVKAIAGLNFVIVRPAIIWGPGDIGGLTPRLIVGAVYKKLAEKMELLWTKDLNINTVHVRDVVRALWHLTSKGDSGATYNLSDSGNTDQGAVSDLVAEIFGIKTSFMGAMMTKLATSVSMRMVADTANDKHLKPWSDLCKEHKIFDTPLTPYLDEELLYNNPTSVDGNKITSTGFAYEIPKVTADLLREVIRDYEAKGFFPKGIAN